MDSLEVLQIWLKVHHFSSSFLVGFFESLRKKKKRGDYYLLLHFINFAFMGSYL